MIRRIPAVLNIGPGRWLALLLGLASTSLWAQVSASCDGLHNTYCPFDYRTANKDLRRTVENAHFTYCVESLTRGATGAFGGDISYTRAVFPNHHRAMELGFPRTELRDRLMAAGKWREPAVEPAPAAANPSSAARPVAMAASTP